MKTFVHIALVAACLIACAHALPGARRDSIEDDFDDENFGFVLPSVFDTFTRLRQSLLDYFWNIPDMANIPLPEGANTTSTTKIINGHVITINETTYTSGDENGGTVFRIRTIDVKPENDTVLTIGGGDNTEPTATTVKAEAPESRETVEEFNNEIPKNTELTA